MKPLLEKIQHQKDRSFELLQTPNLNDTFYWHYHPEIELVYAKSPQGIRHIGSHISYYKTHDLVLIGSNIPHLNFDYGVENQVETLVVHLDRDFFNQAFLQKPEFSFFKELQSKANQAVAFSNQTIKKVGPLIEELPHLSNYKRLLLLIDILAQLAQSTDSQILNAKAIKTDKTLKTQERIQQVFHWVEEHYTKEIKTEDIAKEIGLSTVAFSRWFKQETSETFINYVIDQRLYHAKNLLLKGRNVSEACFSCGFNNLSYFNRVFKKRVGCNPKNYRVKNL